MNKKTMAGLGLIALGTLVGIGKVMRKDQLDPHTPTEPELDSRLRVVNAAISQIGPQDPKKYWDEVLPDHPGFTGAWCGGFALWCIHQAGLAQGVEWQIGKGFCYQLPQTNNPLPGDIAYIDKPYQHHAIVESVQGDIVNTIDGNQPGNEVLRRTRSVEAITAFYSIDPFIRSGNLSA